MVRISESPRPVIHYFYAAKGRMIWLTTVFKPGGVARNCLGRGRTRGMRDRPANQPATVESAAATTIILKKICWAGLRP